ncbi:MAG: GDSL-type esterase/lipase family protein [Clostridiales Family XIII bacterium]|nr:GDSL-type esterase/lipase family protein [Clostridiales Family XIII bacterium]
MPLGDSLVVGLGSGTSTDASGFRSPLQATLKAAGVDFNFVGSSTVGNANRMDPDNEGHLSYRIDQIAARATRWVEAASPDIVLLLVGHQDVLANYRLSAAIDRYADLLDTVRDAAPGVQIVVGTLVDQPTSSLQRKTDDFNADLRELIDQQAIEFGDVTLVELSGILERADYLGTVPNDPGYKKISQAFAAGLADLLPAANKDILTSSPLKIVAMGSSETVGLGSGIGADFAGYRGYLQGILDDASIYYDFVGSQKAGNGFNIDIDHEGYSGWLIGNIGSRIPTTFPRLQPDVVLLNIGSNDCWFSYALNDAPRRFERLIDDIRYYAAPDVKIVVSTVLESTDSSQARKVKKLNESIRDIVATQSAKYGDVYLADLETALIKGRDYFDVLHPDDSGYEKIANIFANTLSEFIDGLNVGVIDDPDVPSTPAVTIMPFGDSITLGLGSGLGSSLAGYRGYLYDSLSGSDLAFDFIGSNRTGLSNNVDPDHEGYLSLRIDQLTPKVLDAVSGTDPDVILLYAGTADLTLNYRLGTAIDRFEALLDEVRAAAPYARIIVSTVIDPATRSLQSRVDTFNDDIRQLVADRAGYEPIWLAEMSGVLRTGTDHFSALVPVDSGYRKMADVWEDAILRALAERPVFPDGGIVW